jgi:hypothetical protein
MREGALALAALLALSACDFGGGKGSGGARAVARCKDARGDVRSHAALVATWSPLSPGNELAQGDWIQTAGDAFARIELFSGSMLDVEPSSVVVLEEESDGDVKEHGVGLVSLRSGRVRGVVEEKEAKPHEVVVKTPSGKSVRIAPVSGTGELAYRVAAEENGDLELAISRGRATVKAADGASVTLAKGEAQAVKAGRLQGEVIALPNPPEPVPPSKEAIISASRPVELRWKEEPHARYRIQIAEDETFRRLIVDETVDSPAFSFKPPKGGAYAWRVAAKNERGSEGDFSSPEKLVALDPISDRLSGPPDGAAISFQHGSPTVAFAWRPDTDRKDGAEKPRYEILIARGTDLGGEIAVKQTLETASFATRRLGPGEYRWMVYRLVDGERIPISPEPRRLVVRKSASGIQLPKKLKWE